MESVFLSLSFGLLILFNVTIGQSCNGRRCGECVVSGDQFCSWCAQEKFVGSRCDTFDELLRRNCSKLNIIRRKDQTIEYLQNNDVQDRNETSDAIQLQPQHVRVHLNPNDKKKKLNITYSVARNYPVDLYFLSDASYTMRNFRDTLVNLADQIGDAIDSMTEDYRFGYGTAMEKVVLPFTSTSPRFLENSCYYDKQPDVKCAPPYSFKHSMTLAKDIEEFRRHVNATESVANLDSPEGGFDGLMQVLVCSDLIGWRNRSRRLLIFASDADFHLAGDGRLAGIVVPNDGKCNTDAKTNMYTMSLLQDYPSIGQIKEKVTENTIIILFVVLERQVLDAYTALAQEIGQSSVQYLDKNITHLSNIIGIIENTYQSIRESVTIVVEEKEDIEFVMKTTCGPLDISQEGRVCKKIKPGVKIVFQMKMAYNSTSCPSDPDKWTDSFKIYPKGLKEELIVDLAYNCQCDCELEAQAEKNSIKCNNGNGTFACGVCSCHEGWQGEFCMCDKRKTEVEACSPSRGNFSLDTTICSGVGQCVCGLCECYTGVDGEDLGFSGEFCQCEDRNCGEDLSNPCSGNGVCNCGVCQCLPGFDGDICECPLSTASCENNGTICTGNGECICGECKCKPKYVGETCQQCTGCTQGICEGNRACAMCKIKDDGKSGDMTKDECERDCSHVTVVEELDSERRNDSNACQFKDVDNCGMSFIYHFDDTTLLVYVRKTTVCPPKPADVMTIVISIASAVFLVALILLLVWRLFASLYDGIEYSKFQQEVKNPQFGFDDNPLFVSPTSKYENPMHEKQADQTF